MVLLCASTVDHITFYERFLKARKLTIQDATRVTIKGTINDHRKIDGNQYLESARQGTTFIFAANKGGIKSSLSILDNHLQFDYQDTREDTHEVWTSMESYTDLLDVHAQPIYMINETGTLSVMLECTFTFDTPSNILAYNTIALYCLVHAIVPERTSQMRASRQTTVNAMQNLHDALDKLDYQPLSHDGVAVPESHGTRTGQHAVLAEYRHRVLQTLGDVKCNIERSVSTANQSRPHYAVSLARMAILMPMLNEYAKYNLYRRCTSVPTFWGYNSHAMVNGCWTLHNSVDNSAGSARHIPYVYVACLHLYYLLFNGPEYVGPLKLSLIPELRLPQMFNAILGAQEICNFWNLTYCNADGNVAGTLINFFTNAELTLSSAQHLEYTYCTLYNLECERLLPNFFEPYCTNGNVTTSKVGPCSYSVQSNASNMQTTIQFANSDVPDLERTITKHAHVYGTVLLDTTIVDASVQTAFQNKLKTCVTDGNHWESEVLTKLILVQRLALFLFEASVSNTAQVEILAHLWTALTLWYYFGCNAKTFMCTHNHALTQNSLDWAFSASAEQLYLSVLEKVKGPKSTTPLMFFQRISMCDVLSTQYWLVPYGLRNIMHTERSLRTTTANPIRLLNNNCLFNTCLTTRIAKVTDATFRTFKMDVLASAFENDTSTDTTAVVDTNALVRTAASTIMTAHEQAMHRRSHCSVEAWPQSILLNDGKLDNVLTTLFWNNYRCVEDNPDTA